MKSQMTIGSGRIKAGDRVTQHKHLVPDICACCVLVLLRPASLDYAGGVAQLQTEMSVSCLHFTLPLVTAAMEGMSLMLVPRTEGIMKSR